jgi:hypothetical protein
VLVVPSVWRIVLVSTHTLFSCRCWSGSLRGSSAPALAAVPDPLVQERSR